MSTGRGGKDCFDLRARQKMHLTFVVPLARYRENALDMGAVGRLLEGHEAEEGADGGQAQVARPHAHASLRLKFIEKRTDERCVQIIERQGRRRLAKLRLYEREQETESIPVGGGCWR